MGLQIPFELSKFRQDCSAAEPYVSSVLRHFRIRFFAPLVDLHDLNAQGHSPRIRCFASNSTPLSRIPLANMIPLGAGSTIASWMAGRNGLISISEIGINCIKASRARPSSFCSPTGTARNNSCRSTPSSDLPIKPPRRLKRLK